MYVTLGLMGFGVVWCASSEDFIFASFVVFKMVRLRIPFFRDVIL